MEFPSLETRAGQVFLTGRRAVLNRGQWTSRTPVAIQWSAVVHYMVFESRDDYYQRALAAWKAKRARKR